jgi:hypothetical protein
MELTFEIPDELAHRLSGREQDLARVIELGLEALEDEESAAEDTPISPEELVAHARGELEEGQQQELLERLALDADAADDLLDYHRFETLEPPSEEHRISDGEAREALEALRRRIGEESRAGEVIPFEPRARPGSGGLRAMLGFAAGLILAFALLYPGLAEKEDGLEQPTVIELLEVRGAPTYTVAKGSSLFLKLPQGFLPRPWRGRIEIVRGGKAILQLREWPAENSDLLKIPSGSLSEGTYRLRAVPAESGDPDAERLLDFEIQHPPEEP